jgi:hypothetical protein
MNMKEGLKSNLRGFSVGNCSSREPSSNPGFCVTVISTTPVGTAGALNAAIRLGKDLGARITLLSFEPVRFHTFPDQPPLISDSIPVPNYLRTPDPPGQPGDVEFRICFYRDVDGDLPRVLRRPSLVVLGGKRHWWATREQRLEKALRRLGHHVIFVDLGSKTYQSSYGAFIPLSVSGTGSPSEDEGALH